jgi:hypothetical protein
MSFFSWFKSKSPKSDQDESQLRESTASQEKQGGSEVRLGSPVRVPPRLRDLVPHSQPRHATEAAPGEALPPTVRATVDVPLQALLQQLPKDVVKTDIDLDPKRRIQIPRKSLQVNESQHSATVTYAVLFAACPEIFSIPIPPMDQRTLEFNLPAWEQPRVESLSEKSPAEIQTSEPATPSVVGDAGKTIRLPLKPILENLPPEFQPSDITGLLDKPALTIDLPLELIQSQMANGKVTVPYSVFLRSLPEEARIRFTDSVKAEEVSIPIKEIVPNYPTNLLHPRPDQQPEETIPPIVTPFAAAISQEPEKGPRSKTAAELAGAADTKQLELIARPLPSVETPSELPGEEPVPEIGSLEPNLRALQSIFLAENSLDLNQVIQKIAELPGISAALLFGAGGKILEGDPEKLGLTPPAVQLLSGLSNTVGKQAEGLGFGPVETMTLGWARELISVFTRGQAGIVVRHARRPFKPGVREKIGLVLSHISN